MEAANNVIIKYLILLDILFLSIKNGKAFKNKENAKKFLHCSISKIEKLIKYNEAIKEQQYEYLIMKLYNE